ncbi:MAG: FtsX-like permease family protein, partial [Calditrichaeota bacterium]|nr:FtsX-like permease family protein [Calditrichota bacterium]
TKEIGIRKTLGATVPNILVLLSRDFIFLVLVASVVATPLAWWTMNRWLDNFAYKIHIQPLTFVLVAVVALMIALLTVSFQAIKAALANPVKSLKYE